MWSGDSRLFISGVGWHKHLGFPDPSNRVEKVIYSPPATIVFWGDGTKTVVKCHYGDTYSKELGFLYCCAKHMCGNDTIKFHKLMNEWCWNEIEYDDKDEFERLLP